MSPGGGTRSEKWWGCAAGCWKLDPKRSREKWNLGPKRSNSVRIGSFNTPKDRFGVGGWEKIPQKDRARSCQSEKRGSKPRHICITHHIGSTPPGTWDHKPVVRWKDMLIKKHIVSMKLVGLTPVLRPLFPYEFEISAGPSMYPGSGGNSQTGSPPVVQFVGFLGRIRFTPQDEKVLPMDDIQLFRKIKLRLNHY